MMMFLGFIFGLGTIVAPIIVWIKTKGQKRRVLKALGSSLACFIITGIIAVNDSTNYSTQTPKQAQQTTPQQTTIPPKLEPSPQQTENPQPQKNALEDVIKNKGFTIVSAEGEGMLMVKKDIPVVKSSWAISTMQSDTKFLLKDIINNGYSDLGNYDVISINFESDDFVDKYGSKTTIATGSYTFKQ